MLLPVRLGGCPAGWKLSRAFLEDGPRDLTEHLDGCRHCAAEWRSLWRSRAMVRALQRPQMSEESFDTIEANLRLGLGAAQPFATLAVRTWPRRAVAVALTCGVFVVGAVVWSRVGGLERGAAVERSAWVSIRAVGETAFSRVESSDEVVDLASGTLELDVGSAPPGKRFQVVTKDGIVESAGSRLSVKAVGHTLVAVRVFAGYAEVRASGVHASLRAGDEWVQEDPLPNEESASIVPPPPSPPLVHAPRPPSFERAWRLLNAGRAAEAAEAFGRVETKSAGDAIVEDAAFWRAVSLERAAKPAAARAVLRAFTERFPRSERFGEASALLGWNLLSAGEADSARRAFERAEGDKVDRVRASARSGLARLGR